MALLRQIWTLMCKNWRCNLLRHPLTCFFMAVLVPLVLGAFFSFAKNLFVPPAKFGIGDARPVRTLASAFDSGMSSGRDKVILVNSGHTGGDIDRVLDQLEKDIGNTNTGIETIRLEQESDIGKECPSSLRGVTQCFSAVVMRSSPDEGTAGFWNYTIRSDAAFADSPSRIVIDKDSNPQQVYLVPIQRAVDSIIGTIDPNVNAKSNPLADNEELAYTSLTPDERDDKIRRLYHSAITNFMGVLFIATVIWVTYHLTGFVATERETGMANLVDSMMPVRWQWMSLFARIVAHHLSFSVIYAPAWIVSSIIVRAGVFANTSIAIVLIFTVLTGLALTSMSILYASFFKRAQLSGITAILATLLLGILAQSITAPGTAIVAALSVLFTPCTFVYMVTLMARFEKQDRPTNLIDMPPESPWELPGIFFFVMVIIHIFAYPLLGFLIERYLYGTSTKGRQFQYANTEGNTLGDDAVKLEGFTKIYKPNIFSRLFATKSKPAVPVTAVDHLSFNAGRGQIVALLGANGSGKSTTLDAIAGLHKLSSGSITIDGTGGLGIAPQKNVLWDDLTVEEHLNIFNRLKSPKARATKQETQELIEAIDLTKKRKALSKTLSGGQKRKLQLGMMLTGGSAVCCVDEVSSGIDPLSRRKLWDILLAERGRRTMILTTHFLDEADLLADHIAILSKGSLRAEGSSVELKDRLGGGYRVMIQKSPGLKATPDIEGVRKKESLDLITYISPTSSLSAQVIKELEAAGIPDYRFSGPTIEDVFLQVAEEIKDEEAFRTTDRGAEMREKASDDDSQEVTEGIKLLDGKRVGYVKQALILLTKRVTILKRNYLPYLIAFFLPILAAGLTSLFIQGQDPPGCSPSDQSSTSSTEDAFSQSDDPVLFVAGPAGKVAEKAITALFAPVLGVGSGGGSGGGSGTKLKMEMVETFNQFDNYIRANHSKVTTGLWLGDDSSKPTFAWVADLFVTSPITAQQFLDGILLNQTIQATWSPFDVPFSPNTGDSLNLTVYMGLALACFPAFFALYPSNERRRFVRALEYSNGVRPFPLWIAYLIFDFAFALVSSAIATAMWAGMSNIWYHLEYVFVVLFLYGLASILLSYFVSLFTKTQLATYAWAACIQVVGFLAYLIAYMCVNTYSPVEDIGTNLLIVHFVISAVIPIGSAMRALFLTLNLFSTACDGDKVSSTPNGILQYGAPILFLIVQSLLLFGLILWFDSGSVSSSIRSLLRRDKVVHKDDEDDPSDEEVAAELNRVTSSGTHEDGLRVMHLTKTFKTNTAVDNVSFGIRRGEVFALLGPNGAGKSTTISLIRGDIKPSRNGGDVFVEEESVTRNLPAARANLGVCPQIDAMDQMTVREHLAFYAKVRGIPDVEHNVAAVLHAVGLEAFAGRIAHALSGGNKRKLSLGIALMGNPTVVLLDEPSSGLDAASKRIMWKTLASTVPGRSILLTTHSMEEADALAGRAGIMARRMLAVGSPDDLRHRFGDALHIHLVHSNAPRTTEEEMNEVIAWIRQKFPSADIDEKTYHGQLRFSVRAADVLSGSSSAPTSQADAHHQQQSSDVIAQQPADLSQSAIGHLVVLLEENKAALGVGHYSVSPTTLDQVFLSIVGAHNVKEEGYEDKKTPGWKKLLLWKK